MEKRRIDNSTNPTQIRNYELDAIKFLFTGLIFLHHTQGFIGEKTRFIFPVRLGTISVHFFFIVSGLLMANSIIEKSRGQGQISHERQAIQYVLKKFKSIAGVMSAAILIKASIYLSIYTFVDPSLHGQLDGRSPIITLLTGLFSEWLDVTMAGLFVLPDPTWYISAMLIVMLPLAYLLLKKPDFTLYVFSPLASILLLGYMAQINKFAFLNHYKLFGLCMGGLIRATCGMCAGICAYTICCKVKELRLNKKLCILLTMAEVVLYLVFFGVWFFAESPRAIMLITLVLPIALAITFSEKSYLKCLFCSKWMKHFAPLSLYIYLNHWGPTKMVEAYYSGRSYKFCTAIMTVYTLICCLICWLLVTGGRTLWEKRLKPFLLSDLPEETNKFD